MSNHNDDLPPEDGDLTQKLKLESGRINWSELQRHFARDVVLVVAGELDLIEVASKLSEDDTPTVETWLNNKQLWRAQDEDAHQWHASSTEFCSVVVAPWVLVQAIT